MNRSVMTNAAALGAALIAAYFVWTREPDTSAGDISILSIRGGIDKIRYEEPDLEVAIEKRKDGRGAYYWVKTKKMVTPPRARKPEPPAPTKTPAPVGTTLNKDPKAEAEADKEAPLSKEMKITTPKALAPALPKVAQFKEFRGNETTEKLIEELSTLTALRTLGKVDATKLKTFGLKDSKRKLVLTMGKTNRIFIIGDKTHGNMDYYVQDTQDERVYVIKPKQMQNLKYAEYRLIDRRLYDFKTDEIDTVKIMAKVAGEDKSQSLTQHNRRKSRAAFWSLTGSNKREELYTNWMTKLLRLRVSDYLQPGIDAKDLLLVMKADFSLGPKLEESLALYKAKAAIADGKDLKEGDYLVQTGHTRKMVKLTKSVADEIAREIDGIVGK